MPKTWGIIALMWLDFLSVADLVLCDLGAPVIIDADKLISKSKNSPFDGRRLQGQVLMTLVDGRIVHQTQP